MDNYTVICGPNIKTLLISEPGTTGLYSVESVKGFLEFLQSFDSDVNIHHSILTDQSLSDPSELPFILLRVVP
jgi:hypothetical protein